MSPKEPLPIFRPSRYLFPTLSSMVASCHYHQQKCDNMSCSIKQVSHWVHTTRDFFFYYSQRFEWGMVPSGDSCSHDPSVTDTANRLCVCVDMLLKQDFLIGNSCLASRDTWLGSGGGRWLKWDQQRPGREEKEMLSQRRAQQNVRWPLETSINCHVRTRTWTHIKRN